MASIPTPRSRQQILSDMLDSLSLATGISRFKVGGPLLSILEAASSADASNAQDILQLLASIGLDTAEGLALDNIGNNEGVGRLFQSNSTGTVTITDSSITKKVSKLRQDKPAPIVGSGKIYVEDLTGWTGTGSVYVGRGTANVEGPLAYNAINTGTGEITLTGTTTIFHNKGETVTLAQGGNRIISAGTVVSTPQGSISGEIKFSTSYTTVLLDGEITLEGVQVIAQEGGLTGNVPAFSISEFSGPSPFTGATVSNPLPFVNGRDTETDNDYKERIRSARNSKQRGTQLAIENAVVGTQSVLENKAVSSASLVRQRGQTATLYIDDGTGYEEQSDGVGLEVVVDSAIGGEQDFSALNKPIAKAFVETTNSAPFVMVDGSKLNVLVGDTVYSHSFSSGDFNSILAASAYEVVASINANNSLGFSARVTGSGLKVAIQAKSETNDEIQLQSVATGDIDSNEALLFPVTKARTAMLYKNDRLLSKDGLKAVYKSQPFADWANFSGSQTLYLQVDQTPASIYVFNAQDFIDANTGYGAVGKNSLAAWAAVINASVAGVTATVELDRLALTSNVGESAGAAVVISGGSLVANNMFAAGADYGSIKDYELERSTGQVYLNEQLAADDRLTFGSLYTRAFLESLNIDPVDVLQDKSMWWAVDGQTTLPTDGVTTSSALTASISKVTDAGMHVKVTCSDPDPVFDNVAEGDWAVFHDASLLGKTVQNAWRVLDPQDSSISFEKRGMNAPRGGFQLVSLGTNTAIAIGGFTALHPKQISNDGPSYIPELDQTKVFAGRCHTATCEIFDKTTGTWTYCDSMSASRVNHTATLFDSGNKVLVVGGIDSEYSSLYTTEIYDIATDTWSAGPNLPGNVGRSSHTATLLDSGNVLIAGGCTVNGATGAVTTLSTSCEYDPGTNTFPIGKQVSMVNYGGGVFGRYAHAACLIPSTNVTHPSKVLAAGGYMNSAESNRVEMYDPAIPSWASKVVMNSARSNFSLIVIPENPNTHLVAVGGSVKTGTGIGTLDKYEVSTNTWTSTSLTSDNKAHSAACLPKPGAANDNIYVFYTSDETGAPNASCKHLTYDRSGDSFVEGTSSYCNFSIGKANAGVCALGTDVLIAGGINYNYNGVSDSWARPVANYELFDSTGLISDSTKWNVLTKYSDVTIAASGLAATTLPDAGLTFARTAEILQETTITTANDYTADTFVSEINSELRGATAEVYRTNKVRVRTNSFAETIGDLALVGSNCSELSIDAGQVETNEVGHLASVDSGNPGVGTPEDFRVYNLAYSESGSRLLNFADAVTYSFATLPSLTPVVAGLKRPAGGKNPVHGVTDDNEILEYGNSKKYFGELAGYTINSASQSQWSFCNNIQAEVSVITAYQQEHLPHEPYIFAHPYAFGVGDELDLVIDGDTDTKNYNVPMSYKLTPDDNDYDQTIAFADLDASFGIDYDFSGFELHMPARNLTTQSGSAAELLWRYKKPGKEGERCCVRIVYPEGPDSDVGATVVYDQTTPTTTNISIPAKTTLPLMTNVNVNMNSGAALEGSVLRDSSRVALAGFKDIAGAPKLFTICGYTISEGQRTGLGASGNRFRLTHPSSGGNTVPSTGIQVGDVLWFEATSPASTTWFSGSFTVQAVTPEVAVVPTYTDIYFVGTDLCDGVTTPVGITPNIGTVSFDTQGELSFDGSINDYFRLSNLGAQTTSPDFTLVDDVTAKIYAVSSASVKQWIAGQIPCGAYFDTDTLLPEGFSDTWDATNNDATPVSLLSTSNISIFGASTCTAASVAAVLTEGASYPVWATAITAGNVTKATFEDSTYVWAYNKLVDGWNIVKSVDTYPVNPGDPYIFELGVAINASLSAGDYDWTNEDVYLVPTTPRAVAKWMNTPCVSGLFSSAEVSTSKAGRYLQVASLTPGSDGAVQISGGTANLATATVHNSAELIDGPFYDGMLVSIPSSEASGLHGGKWVRIDNTYNDTKKDSSWGNLTSIASDGTWTFAAAPFTVLSSETTNPVRVMVEKVNNLVALHFSRAINNSVPTIYDDAHLTGLGEGDYIYLYDGGIATKYTGTTVGAISLNNQGTFKVIRAEENCDTVTVWIENANAVEELSECQYKCIAEGSAIAGDYLTLNSSTFGSSNVKTWIIESVGLSGSVQYVSSTVVVSTAQGAPASWSGATAPAAGELKLQAAAPARLYKKIITVIEDASNTDYTYLFLERGEQVSLVKESLGSVVTALDKLAFSTSKVVGVDGYRYNTGLIGEANKVVYGDPQDEATYPGYAAAGATINIAGPFIRKVQLSLSVRINSAFTSSDLSDRVKSAVATVINFAKIGESVSISSLVAAAGMVPGVVAVAVLKPTYTSVNDTLPVNSNEKLMVLDINNDILVTFVGT